MLIVSSVHGNLVGFLKQSKIVMSSNEKSMKSLFNSKILIKTVLSIATGAIFAISTISPVLAAVGEGRD